MRRESKRELRAHRQSLWGASLIARLTVTGLVLLMVGAGARPAGAQLPLVTWETQADIPGGIEGAAAGIIGTKLYVSHGYRGADSADLSVYDIPSDTWAPGPAASFVRSEMVGAVAGGKFYAIGGRTTGNEQIVEIYDPATNSWSRGADMPTGRGGMGAATVNGLIHVIGGRPGGGSGPGTPPALNAHEVYNPGSDTWGAAPPLPVAVLDNYATVAFGSRIYVLGGDTGGAVVNLVQIYDTGSGAWTTGAPMPTARSNAVAGVLCSRIAVVGGIAGGPNLATTEIYDPSTNTWTAGPDKPRAASEFAVGAPYSGNALFAVGSGIEGLQEPFNDVLRCTASPAPAMSWLGLALLLAGLLVAGSLILGGARRAV